MTDPTRPAAPPRPRSETNVVPLRHHPARYHSAPGLHRVNTWAAAQDAHQLTPDEQQLNTRLAAYDERQRAQREQQVADQLRFERRLKWAVALVYGGGLVGLILLVWAWRA